ncbi:MAG: hypothetical protein OXP11_23375 [Gammaproteobacteria bacterium]|nr:hypothetical protein [Gammaproteobacteria bacterium]
MPPVLSPVPTSPVALANALAYLRGQIGYTVDGGVTPSGERAARVDWPDDARLTELLGTASALVEREAPGAPQAIRNEAVVRVSGYWLESSRSRRFGAVRKAEWGGATEAGITGSVMFEATTNHAAAFLHSGAKGLLSSWKVRRAGAIG